MSADLTSLKILNTFGDIIQVPNSNDGIDGTLRDICDGKGTTGPIKFSSTGMRLNATATFDAEAGATFLGTNFTYTGTWNMSAVTFSDLGTVTTVDINGGTIDGVIIGASAVAAGSFAALVATTGILSDVITTNGASAVAGVNTMRGTTNGDRILILESAQAAPDGLNIRFTAAAPNDRTRVFEKGTDSGGDKYKIFSDGGAEFGGDVDPAVTETLDIGSATFEWDNIFLQNSPTVSDERRKNNLGPIGKSLIELMRQLDPRIFSRKNREIPEKIQTEQQQKIQRVKREVEKIEIRNGKAVLVKSTETIDKPVFDEIPVVDENGKPVTQKVETGKNAKGEPIFKDVQLIHREPQMEEIKLARAAITVTHGRPHTGFMAQAVKAKMDELGIADWAGYAYHNDEGEDTHVLRLMEFIAPILAYTQEIDERLKTIENA